MHKRENGSLEPLMVSPDQAAEILGLGRTKIWEMIADGKLTSRKEGARRLVLVSSIKAYVAAAA